MEEQTLAQVRHRVRRRSLGVLMELTLRDAEAAATADPTTQRLIQTRLNILSKALARERSDKMKRLTAEVERLTVENTRLRSELAQALTVKVTTTRPDIAKILSDFQRENNGGPTL